jgi:hypothetical protein
MMERDAQPEAVSVAGWKRDAVLLLLLLALVLPLRLWLLSSAVATARDGIGYIRYATSFEHYPWQKVWQGNHQHPGYPLAILLVSQPVRAYTGATDAPTMQYAGQLTSMLAALVLLYPMYHLGRLLFDRRVGFGGALLFQYLPISGHHLSDGISEALFLLFVATALLQAVRALQASSVPRFVLCGVFIGLAYFTRPEGALILLGAAGVLFAMQLRSSTRLAWRQFGWSASALLGASAACAAPYLWVVGLTQKWSVLLVINAIKHAITHFLSYLPGVQAAGGGGPLFALSFTPSDDTSAQLLHSARALVLEVSNGYHYVGVLPAALGLFWSFGRLRRMPGFWALVLYCTIHTSILLALALTVSYVSDRHVMVLVLCGTYFAVAGLCELPRRVLPAPGPVTRLWLLPSFWSVVLFAGLIGFCLPKTLQPLHANRLGNKEVGRWLSKELQPGDMVDDDHCWSHYYAGEVFRERDDPKLSPEQQPTCYVVITRAQNRDVGVTRRQREEALLSEGARLVYHWPPNRQVEQAQIVVYSRPRSQKDHPWGLLPKYD